MAEQKLNAKLGLDTKEYDAKLKNAEGGMKRFGSALSGIGAAMAGVFAVGKLVDFTKESMKLAASMEGIKNAFETIGSPGLLKDLQQATRGTVDNLSLMQKAVQAKNFKIPLEQLATYFRFATNRAIQTGESVDYLVNSIITGIGRKSVLVMDNLGISASELQEEVKKVGDFGIASGNIIRRELESMGDVADTTATTFERIGTAVGNLKVAWGEFVNSPAVIKFLENITRRLEILADPNIPLIGLKRPTEENVREFNNAQAKGSVSGGFAGVSMYGLLTEDIFSQGIQQTTKAIKESIPVVSEYEKAIRELVLKLLDEAEAAKMTAEAISRIKKDIGGTAPSKANVPGLEAGVLGVPLPEAGGLRGPGQGITQEFIDQQLAIQKALDKNAKELEREAQAAYVLEDAFMSLFSNIDQGWQDMMDSLISGIKRLIAEMLAKQLVKLIMNYFGGSGNVGSIISNFVGGSGGVSPWDRTSSIGSSSSSWGGKLETDIKGKDIGITLRRYIA